MSLLNFMPNVRRRILAGGGIPFPTDLRFDFNSRTSNLIKDEISGDEAEVVGGYMASCNGSSWFKTDLIKPIDSLSFLINPTASNGIIFGKPSDSKTEYIYLKSDNRIQFYINGVVYNGLTQLTLGSYHLLDFQQSGNNIELYDNGGLIDTFIGADFGNLLYGFDNIGSWKDGSVPFYNGLIADIVVDGIPAYYLNNHFYNSNTGEKGLNDGVTFEIVNDIVLRSTTDALELGFLALDTGEQVVNKSLNTNALPIITTVASNGSGDFTTLKAALVAIDINNTTPRLITFNEELFEHTLTGRPYTTVSGIDKDTSIINGYLDPNLYTLAEIQSISTIDILLAQNETLYKNCKILAQNCRYAVHLDSENKNTSLGEVYNRFYNVDVIHNGNTEVFPVHGSYGFGSANAMGTGFCANNQIIIEDCYLESKAFENTAEAFKIHQQNIGAVVNSRVFIKNTICKAPSGQPDITITSANIDDVFDFENVSLGNSNLNNSINTPFNDTTTIIDGVLDGKITKL